MKYKCEELEGSLQHDMTYLGNQISAQVHRVEEKIDEILRQAVRPREYKLIEAAQNLLTAIEGTMLAQSPTGRALKQALENYLKDGGE